MLLVAVTSTVTIARVYYPVLLVAAIVYPLYLLPLGKNSRMQENAERSLRDVKAKNRGFIIETFENIKDIKIYGAEQASTEVFGGLQEQWSEDIKQKYVAVNMFKSVPRVLAALGPALVYIFAGIAVIHGNLSIGSVVTLAALLPKLSEPIRAYSGFYIDINVVEKIGEKFQQFLSAPREIQYDLPEREKVARQNYQKAVAERMEKATTLEEKLDPFGAESGRMSTNLNNKIVANDGRNMEIKSTVERMERYFVPTLVRLFPGKKGEVIKYIRLAGYQGGEINDLVDRTVGRGSTTEFLYKGRSSKDAR